MRGEDRTSGALFSYVDLEARIPAKHPLRAMRRTDERPWPNSIGRFRGFTISIRTAVDCAGAFAAGDASAASLYDPLGAPAGRADRNSPFCFAVRVGFPSTRTCSTPRRSQEPRPLTHMRRSRRSFLASLIALPEVMRHERRAFSVDGTLLKAWASMKFSSPKMVRARRRPAAMERRISARRNVRRDTTPRRRTRMRVCSGKPRDRKAVSPISATR